LREKWGSLGPEEDKARAKEEEKKEDRMRKFSHDNDVALFTTG